MLHCVKHDNEECSVEYHVFSHPERSKGSLSNVVGMHRQAQRDKRSVACRQVNISLFSCPINIVKLGNLKLIVILIANPEPMLPNRHILVLNIYRTL